MGRLHESRRRRSARSRATEEPAGGHQAAAKPLDTASGIGNQRMQSLARRAHASADRSMESHERQADELASRRATSDQSIARPRSSPSPLDQEVSPGRPIDPRVRAAMEDHFGADFSGVRVHTDHQAHELASMFDARAFTSGADIVFGAGEHQPESTDGRRLIAHELAHVVQQADPQSEAPAIQRQSASKPLATRDPFELPGTVLPGGKVSEEATARGLTLWYFDGRHITIEAQPGAAQRKPFAYNYLPRTIDREFDIIRIVAAPGASVRSTGFDSTPSFRTPLIEIYRVQDPELVPAKGELISGAALTATTKVAADELAPWVLSAHEVVIDRVANGVDFLNMTVHRAIRIRVPPGAPDARFAWQVKLGGEGLRPEPTVITILKTPSVEVAVSPIARGELVTSFVPLVYEVDNIADVPAQGSVLHETGRRVTSVKAQVDETLEQTFAMASVDVAIGAIPVVGDFVDVAEFFYGIVTGRDRWGRKLTAVDLGLMGIGALLPIVSGSLLRGAKAVGRGAIKVVADATGKSAEQAGRMVRGLGNLTEAELANVRRWDEALRRGEKLPEAEIDIARRVLAKIGRALPGEEGAAASAGRTLKELLNDTASGFRDPELQEAYRRFLSEAAPGGAASPVEWLRKTQGRTRLMVQAYLGPEAAAIEFAENARDYVAALRKEPPIRGSAGRSWDWQRFPELPDGVKWQVGDPINMADISGKYPTWNVARKRYWMNRADAEIQSRAGGAAQELGSSDPISRLSDKELQTILKEGTAPPDPFHAGRKMEVEHAGVPQRVVKMISELGGDFEKDALRLAEVSEPGRLLEVTPLEHAFHDYYAHTFSVPGRMPVINPRRADITGAAWAFTALGDPRVTRPLERMTDQGLLALIDRARKANADFNRTAGTRALRDALNAEIGIRQLPATLLR